MKIKATGISDVGCARSGNEDMILVNGDIFRDKSKEDYFVVDDQSLPVLIAVADGMGGHNAGEYASEIVLSQMDLAVKSLPLNLTPDVLKNKLHIEISSIHQYLLSEGNQNADKAGMGSTFAGLLFYQNNTFLINIGDSRCYRYRSGFLTCLSRDHSLREMTGNQNAPANIIVNSFGAGETVFFDFVNITSRLMDKDILLLCSDGLTNELTDIEIERLLGNENGACLLMQRAKDHGGKDNISLIEMSVNMH